MKLCECGCGQEVTHPCNRFVLGHNGRGEKHSVESRKKMSKTLTGRKLTEDHKRKVSEGNKGKVVSDGTRKKMSESHKRHTVSEETKRKISEGNKGKSISNETRLKLSETKKNMNNETRRKMSESATGRFMSKDAKQKMAESHMGKKSHFWKGGISFLPYCHKFNHTLKEKIRNRDNRTCQLCNTPENGKTISIHHIHYDKENCYPDLITLCSSCNSKVNSKRDYWEIYFMNKLNDRKLLLWTKINTNI